MQRNAIGKLMSIKKLLGVAFAVLLAGTLNAGEVVVNPDHPDRYVVVKGDTLWDITGRFLRDPWLWPEVWHTNPQIKNPHLIYPGDVLTLVYVDGKPRIQLQRGDSRTVTLSPHARVESLEGAIPTIPIDAIKQFLTKPLVTSERQMKRAPYIVANADEHIISGIGDRVYVRGIDDMDYSQFDIYRPGQPLKDPDNGKTLGFEAVYVGEGAVEEFGDPATLALSKTTREARQGDRLSPADLTALPIYFTPHPPPANTEGRIISVLDGVSQIGQFQVVAISRGKKDGINPGTVMAIDQAGQIIRDPISVHRGETVKLPDEEAGHLMVFRTFDRVSYAVVVDATRSIHVLDKVRNP